MRKVTEHNRESENFHHGDKDKDKDNYAESNMQMDIVRILFDHGSTKTSSSYVKPTMF